MHRRHSTSHLGDSVQGESPPIRLPATGEFVLRLFVARCSNVGGVSPSSLEGRGSLARGGQSNSVGSCDRFLYCRDCCRSDAEISWPIAERCPSAQKDEGGLVVCSNAPPTSRSVSSETPLSSARIEMISFFFLRQNTLFFKNSSRGQAHQRICGVAAASCRASGLHAKFIVQATLRGRFVPAGQLR